MLRPRNVAFSQHGDVVPTRRSNGNIREMRPIWGFNGTEQGGVNEQFGKDQMICPDWKSDPRGWSRSSAELSPQG